MPGRNLDLCDERRPHKLPYIGKMGLIRASQSDLRRNDYSRSSVGLIVASQIVRRKFDKGSLSGLQRWFHRVCNFAEVLGRVALLKKVLKPTTDGIGGHRKRS
jgi:cation transport regulator ChaB